MDPKEVKSALKEAREAIKAKEYKTAIKNCKAVLKADKENYNAWVFLAAAAQETDQMEQAEVAFQKAIELQPDQVLAWQGLSGFYEKREDTLKQIDCLHQCTKLLSKDRSKQVESMNRLLSLARKSGHSEKLINALQLKLSIAEDISQEETYEIWKEIFAESCQVNDNLGKIGSLRKTAINNIVTSPLFSESDCKKIVNSLGMLYKAGKHEESIEFASMMRKTGSAACLEFLLQAAVDVYIRNGTVLDGLEGILVDAKSYNVSVGLCSIAQGLLFLLQKDYIHALQELREGVPKKRDFVEGWYILANVQLQLHLNSEAESTAKTGLRISLSSRAASELIGKFYLLLGQALSASRMWEASLKSLEKCVEYMGRTADTLKAFCYTLLEMGHVEQAQKVYAELCSSLDSESTQLQLEGYLHVLRQEYPAALQKLRQSVSLEESAFTLHLIGRVLWETKQPDKAVKVFVKAAELDPFYSRNFTYLGHYYMQCAKDYKKAQQCYQKAFDLDCTDEDTWMPLCNVLTALGEHEANLAVLYKVTAQPSCQNNRWAWTQLGLCQMQTNKASEAVFSLQKAIRADPFSSYGWECLGDAYLKRGSYESSLKAFEKAAELDPKSMYPLYQVSTIQKVRGLYEDAIERYKTLLEVKCDYIPALIGLAETLLLLGKKFFSECLFGRSRDCFQEALEVLARVADVNPSFSCMWKLAGDACTLSFGFDNVWFPISVPAVLMIPQETQPVPCQKQQLLALGTKFYGQALSLKGNLGGLWHDLGISYHFQSKLAGTLSEKEEFCQKAFICLQKAVSLSPARHDLWTTLGVVARETQDFALAQHAFITSIEIEKNNVEAWTNLGVLYLENENIELAHKALKVAQSLDPGFPLCWVGQAIIAYSVQHSETIDLYRHATTLGSQTESLLGYGRTVCKALMDISNRGTELYKYNIEEMDAICVACDCVTKYTANNKKNPEAYNILGLLLERQGLYNEALKAFKRSVDLFAEAGKTSEVEKVRANYARLLSTIGQYEEAISEYLKLSKVDQSLLCSFALALLKNRSFEKSFEVFQRALNVASSTPSENKSHILVAMGMVARNIQASGSVPNSADLLIKSTQCQPPSVYGLLALYAMGILQKQPSLVAAVQIEITQFKKHAEHGPDIAMLDAVQAYIKEGVYSARNELLKAIHIQPSNPVLWLRAASSLLQWDCSYADHVATCSRVAVFHGGDKELASQVFVLSQLAAGYRNVSLRAAEKAVHIRPDKLSNWITLAAACHVSKANRSHTGWIYSFVQKLAKQQGIQQELLGWLVCIEVFHNLCSKNIQTALRYLQQASSVKFPNPKIQSTIQILSAFVAALAGGKLETLSKTVENNASNFLGWQLLSTLLIRTGKLNEAEKALAHFVMAAKKHFPKQKTYPLLQLAALSYQALQKTDDKDKMLRRANDFVTEAVKISPENQAARFLQALIALKMENANLARRSLEKVLFCPRIKEEKWVEKMALQLLIPLYVKKSDREALQRLVEHNFLDHNDLEKVFPSALSE